MAIWWLDVVSFGILSLSAAVWADVIRLGSCLASSFVFLLGYGFQADVFQIPPHRQTMAGTQLRKNGKSGNFTFHLYLASSGDSMLELIQPVSGHSIFQDYLDLHTDGGVQHIAYMVAETKIDNAVAEFTSHGYPVITSLRLPVASVAFFDPSKEIGVVTEIIGLTEAGTEFMQQLKYGSALATETEV